MNIYQKLSAISNELTAVAKNLNVGYGKSSYKAVGEADVLAAVKPLEAKYGVYSYPFARRIVESGTLSKINSDGVETKQLFERIEVVYRFVDMDKPEDYVDIISYGDGIDTQDKSVGKAMTYADKYALLKAYKIITGEDPDQYASEPSNKVETRKVHKPISPELVNECEELKIALKDIAAYYNKPVEELTDADVTRVVVGTKKKRAKAAAEKAAAEAAAKEAQPNANWKEEQ